MKDMVLKARQDVNARESLIMDFQPLVKKCVRIYVKDFNFYEDAIQEGNLTILNCIEGYDINSEYSFAAYVKRAVIYAIRDYVKRIKYDASLDETINEDGGSLYDILASDTNVENDNIKKIEIEILKKAINRLSEKQRKVIEDYYFKNLSMMEICKHRRCHYMSVVKLKDRAIESLRKEIGTNCK